MQCISIWWHNPPDWLVICLHFAVLYSCCGDNKPLAAIIMSHTWHQFCSTECLAMPATSNPRHFSIALWRERPICNEWQRNAEWDRARHREAERDRAKRWSGTELDEVSRSGLQDCVSDIGAGEINSGRKWERLIWEWNKGNSDKGRWWWERGNNVRRRDVTQRWLETTGAKWQTIKRTVKLLHAKTFNERSRIWYLRLFFTPPVRV